ncbi:unnamed protein product [Phaedon cochleariae]|uniref:Phospholipase A2 n=1 Tax=Phaedon cochleariae TaxID=80249 RepID=A0A9P0DQW3_PHACE|nr:unnamed protein product [Phaedon cochleariae]
MLLTRHENVVMHVVFFILFALGINGKPSFSLNFPAFGPFANFGKEPKQSLKSYSGKRVTNDSIRMVYFNYQTVAVVELGPNKLLLNCELIEIFEPDQVFSVLGQLKSRARPVGVTFQEMTTLMDQCKQLEDMSYSSKHEELLKNESLDRDEQARGAKNPFTLLSGIIPGTRWCGTGDIARNYFDLGAEPKVDSCCRLHDLCPVKIRAYSEKYNLTNNSLYTKSHCKCDDDLFHCLKAQNQSHVANIMGNIYFNIVQVPCIEESKSGWKFRTARNSF